MSPLKLVFQHHLPVDLKRLAAFVAGFEVESFLHSVGRFQGFGFKSVLFTR